MIQKLLIIASTAVFLLSSLSSIPTNAAQRGQNYKLPFKAGEVWKTDYDYGVHADSKGLAFDFYATDNSTRTIIAPGNGTLTRGCSVNNVTYLRLDTDEGDTFRFMHLRADSVKISDTQSMRVSIGDYLGTLSDERKADTNGCNLSTDTAHVHFSWITSMCPLNIDGFNFDCNGMTNCAGTGVYNTNCNKKYLGTSYNSTNITNPNYHNDYNQKIRSRTMDSLVLTVRRGETIPGTQVFFWEDRNMASQKWTYDNSTKEIRGLNNMCLDGGEINNPGNRWLRIDRCHGGQHQKWTFNTDNQIRTLANPNLCIDSPLKNQESSNLYLGVCHEGSHQKFNFDSIVPTPDSTNSFVQKIVSTTDPNLGLQTVNNNWRDQAQVRLEFVNNPTQGNRWQYDPITEQIFGINNKCLDAGDVKDYYNSWLRINNCHSGAHQKWYWENGLLKSRANNGCVDSPQKNSVGSNVYLNSTCHGANHQKWTLQ